jgi:hypothetical protein
VRSARERRCFKLGRAHARNNATLHFAMFSAALVLSGISASAATISNRDDKEQKLTIIEGETTVEQRLAPQQVLEKVCLKGCIVRLNDSDDDEYQIDPEDMVSIEDGYLYHDSPDAPAEKMPGDQAAPPPASTAPAPAPAPKQ